MTLGSSAARRGRPRWFLFGLVRNLISRCDLSSCSGRLWRCAGKWRTSCVKAFDFVALQQPIDEHFDPGQFAAFFRCDEGIGDAFASHPASAADAMDIVVG